MTIEEKDAYLSRVAVRMYQNTDSTTFTDEVDAMIRANSASKVAGQWDLGHVDGYDTAIRELMGLLQVYTNENGIELEKLQRRNCCPGSPAMSPSE